MSAIENVLLAYGGGLVLILTALLGAGALAVHVSRSPLHRQRMAELTLAAVLLGIGLLLLPLPRPGVRWLEHATGLPSTVEQNSPPVRTAAVEPSEPGEPTASGESGSSDAWGAPIEPEAGPRTGWIGLLPRPQNAEVPVLAHTTAADPGLGGLAPALQRAPQTTEEAWTDGASALLFARLFLAGALVCSLHLAVSWLLLARLLRRSRPAPRWLAELVPLGNTRVLVAARAGRPFCCGLLRPTIVLPAQLAHPELAARLKAVLLHERAHLAQDHLRGRWIAALAAPALYWHPLYWWLVHEQRRCSELLADDMAADGMSKRRYVAELIALAEQSQRALAPRPAAIAAIGTHKDFLERMETLLMRRHTLPTHSSRLHVAARTVGALLVLSSITVAWGRQSAPTPPEPPSALAAESEPMAPLPPEPSGAEPRALLPQEPRGVPRAPSLFGEPAAAAVPTPPLPGEPQSAPSAGARPAPSLFSEPAGVMPPEPAPLAEPPSFYGSPPSLRSPASVAEAVRAPGAAVAPTAGTSPSPFASRSEPELVASFEFRDKATLGEFLLQSYGQDLWVEIASIDADPSGYGRMTVRLRGERAQEQIQQLAGTVPGLMLLSIASRGPRALPSTPPAVSRQPRQPQPPGATAGRPQRSGQEWESRFNQMQAQISELTRLMQQMQQGSSQSPLQMLPPAAAPQEWAPAETPPEPEPPAPPAPIRGRIGNVENSSHGVMIDRGSNHGVLRGTTFDVYRGNVYKGRLRVTNTTPEWCFGKIDLQAQPFQVGDRVTTEL